MDEINNKHIIDMKTSDLKHFFEAAKKLKRQKSLLHPFWNVVIEDSVIQYHYAGIVIRQYHSELPKELVVIPFDKIMSILGKYKDHPLSITKDGEDIEIIVNNTKIKTIQVPDEIHIPNASFEPFTNIIASDVNSLLTAEKFTADDDLRPVMEGVLLSKSHIVGCDGSGMYFNKRSKEDESGEDVIIPKQIVRMLQPNKSYSLQKRKDPKEFDLLYKFDMGNGFSISFSAVDGTYPAWKSIIPSEHVGSFSLTKSELSEAFKAMEMLGESESIWIRFRESIREIKAMAYTDYEEISISLNGGVKGEGFIGLDYKLLKRIVSSSNETTFKFNFLSYSRALTVNENMLLMPITPGKYGEIPEKLQEYAEGLI